jgi:hypothetical protein
MQNTLILLVTKERKYTYVRLCIVNVATQSYEEKEGAKKHKSNGSEPLPIQNNV